MYRVLRARSSMPGIGIWAAVVLDNPLSSQVDGRLRVFFKDPQGRETEHFATTSPSGLGVQLPSYTCQVVYVPIYGNSQTGLWTIRFQLGQGILSWQKYDEKSITLQVLPGTINGPQHHGITVPIAELMKAKYPSVTDVALSFLDTALLLFQAKGSTTVDASGVHPDEPSSIRDIFPGGSSGGTTTDASDIAMALDGATSLTLSSIKDSANVYSITIKVSAPPNPMFYDTTFTAYFDRVRSIIKLPAGVSVIEKGDALGMYADDKGDTYLTWIDNCCDKQLTGFQPKTHIIKVQLTGTSSYSINTNSYFELGPFPENPKYSTFPTIDYSKWLSDPAHVYWIEMVTKSSTLTLGSTNFLQAMVYSSVHLMIESDTGLKVGFDPATNTTINMMDDAYYSGPNSEPETVLIPNAVGNYTVKLTPTGTGDYHLKIETAENGVYNETWNNGTITLEDLSSFHASGSGINVNVVISGQSGVLNLSSENFSVIAVIVPIAAVVAVLICILVGRKSIMKKKIS
jgi:hypothetical protein